MQQSAVFTSSQLQVKGTVSQDWEGTSGTVAYDSELLGYFFLQILSFLEVLGKGCLQKVLQYLRRSYKKLVISGSNETVLEAIEY